MDYATEVADNGVCPRSVYTCKLTYVQPTQYEAAGYIRAGHFICPQSIIANRYLRIGCKYVYV